MLKIIAKITLIAYCYNLLFFTAMAMECCGEGYGGRRYSISSLSTDGSEYGFSLTTDSGSEERDAGYYKVIKSHIPETVTFTPELMTDSSQQEALEKTLKLSGKIVWSESGVSWSTNDGLVLSFDWSGVLTIASSSNHLDLLSVNPYSFATFNRIILGDNLRVDRLLLQSPKVINSGRNNFIESLTVNNLLNSEDGLFINDSGSSLMVNDFYGKGINLINQGSLTINQALDLQHGDFTNHGSLLGNSFKNIGSFYNYGSLLSNKDLSCSDVLEIKCKVFCNYRAILADDLSLRSDFFINNGAINLSKGQISSNSLHNLGEVIVLDSLEAKVNGFTNDIAGKIVFNNKLKIESLRTDLQVSVKNSGIISNEALDSSGGSIIDLTGIDVINDGVITFGGKTLLRNSRLVNTGKGLGTFASLSLLGCSTINNTVVEGVVGNSGSKDHDHTNGLMIDILSSVNGDNTVINTGFLRINVLQGIFGEVKNAGVFSIKSLGEKDHAVRFQSLDNNGLLSVNDASVVNSSVKNRGQLSIEQGENTGTITGSGLTLEVGKKLKNLSDGVIQVSSLSGNGAVDNYGKVLHLKYLEVKDFTNYGVFANDSLTLKPSQSFSNETGGLVATKHLQAENLSNKGVIESDKLVIKNHLTNHGRIVTSDVDGYYTNNHGEIVSNGNLRIATRDFSNRRLYGQQIAVVKTDGNLTLSANAITADQDSIIEAIGAINLNAGGEIDLGGKVISNHSFNLQSYNLKTTAKITSNGNYQNIIKVKNNLQTFNDKTKTPKKKDYPFSANSRSAHGSEIMVNGKLAVEASSWVHEGLLAIKDDGVIKVKDLSVGDKGAIIGHSGQKSTAQLDVTADALKGTGHVQFANIAVNHNALEYNTPSAPLSLKIKSLDKLSYNSSCPLTLTGIVEGKRLIIQGDVLNQGNLLAHESINIEGTFLNDSNGKADLTGLTVKAKKPIETFINKGELSLKYIKSLGRDYLDLENFGKLQITDHFIADHLKLGKVLNHHDATIGFGMGIYFTGVFTNYGKEIVLPGQLMYSKDIFNHGEMHAQGQFTIDCHNGLFSKLGKVFVDGKLLIEVGEKFNGFDLLKNSDIASKQPVEVKAPTITVNSPLTLRGDWDFHSSNFKVNNRLTAGSLLIKTNTFETGSASQFGDVFALSGGLNIFAKKVTNRYGNLFGKKHVEITADEIVNGTKDINIKDAEGLFDKNGSSITSIGKIKLHAPLGSILNDYGYIVSKSDLEIAALESITSRSGLIQGEGNGNLRAKKILITRDNNKSAQGKGKGCGGHWESRAWGTKHVFRHHDGCNCNGYYTVYYETSVPSIVSILGNDTKGSGKLFLIANETEILASTVTATGDITYGNLLGNNYRLDNKFLDPDQSVFNGILKLTARSGQTAQIKSKGAIRIDTGAVKLSGSVEGLMLNLNAKDLLLEGLGIDSRQKGLLTPSSITINLSDYAKRLSTPHGLIRDNKVATIEQARQTLAVPLHDNYSQHKPIFYAPSPKARTSPDHISYELIPHETDDNVAALITKMIVSDFFKASKMSFDLFTKLRQNSLNQEIITEEELKERVESFIYYKIVQASQAQKQFSSQTIQTMLFIGQDDLSNRGSGSSIEVDKIAKIDVKGKLSILSGVLKASDVLIVANSVDVATKVERDTRGRSYREYFLQQATIEAKNQLDVKSQGDFHHSGALFKSQGDAKFSFIKEIGNAAIAQSYEVNCSSAKGKVTTHESYSQQGLSSKFEVGGNLEKTGEQLIDLTGTITTGQKVTMLAPKIVYKDLYLTSWVKNTTTGKKGLFHSTPTITQHYSVSKPQPFVLQSKEQITLGSKNEQSNDTTLKGGVISTPHLIKQGNGSLTITPSTGKVEQWYVVSGKNPFGSIYYGQTTTTTTLNNPQLHVGKISAPDGAKGHFINCKLDGIKLELDYTTASQHITSHTTNFGNSKGNGWNNAVKVMSIAVALGVQLCTQGMATPLVGSAFAPILEGGLSHLVTTATTSFVANGGNIQDTCQTLASKDNIQNLAINVATNYLVPSSTTPTSNLFAFIIDKLKDEAIRTTVSSSLHTTIKGTNLSEALKQQAKTSVASFFAAVGAKAIGNGYQQEHFNYITHKFLHAINGAIAGTILDGENGALSGAIGAVTAENILDDWNSGAQGKYHDQCIKEAQAQALQQGRILTPQEFQKLSQQILQQQLVKAKISASLAAAIFKQDPDVALLTGSYAAENNLIPTLIVGGMILWEAYECYNVFQQGGTDALTKHLITTGAITIVTAGTGKIAFKIGKAVYPTAQLAIEQFLAKNPAIAIPLNKLVQSSNTIQTKYKNTFQTIYSNTQNNIQINILNKINPKKLWKSKEAESVWHKSPVQRGMIIEKTQGQNLPQNFSTIDRFEDKTGKAVSIKSLDLNASSYQNTTKLTSTLKQYVNKLAKFKGARLSNRIIETHEIKSKVLELYIPHKGNQEQQYILQRVEQYAKQQGVEFYPIIYK